MGKSPFFSGFVMLEFVRDICCHSTSFSGRCFLESDPLTWEAGREGDENEGMGIHAGRG